MQTSQNKPFIADFSLTIGYFLLIKKRPLFAQSLLATPRYYRPERAGARQQDRDCLSISKKWPIRRIT